MRHLIYITLLAITTLMTSCVSRLANHINPNSIPEGVQNTTLLIEDYQYKNPSTASLYTHQNVDSLQAVTGFTYSANQLYDQDKPLQKHPLVIETNHRLKFYNNALLRTMGYYKYPYAVATDSNLVVMNYEMQDLDESAGMIGGGNEATTLCNSDLSQFQYALIRKPVPHCYLDADGNAQESYRYEYYFQNLTTGQTYAPIGVYSSNPNRTLKAIIYDLNEELPTCGNVCKLHM